MANTVIALKKSATPTAAPVSLANGEIAINYADGIIYYKAANGSIASISSGTASFGTVNAAGTLILADMVNDVLDIRSGNNIEISGDAINDRITITANLAPAFDRANSKAFIFEQNTTPTSANSADLWVNTDTGVIYQNFGNTTSPVWAEFGPTGTLANTAPGIIATPNLNFTDGTYQTTSATVIGIAGNNYTISVGASANNWANTKLANATGTFSGDLTVTGNVIHNKQAVIYFQPSAAINAAIHIAAANTRGGAGYADVFKLTNLSGGTNPDKWVRLGSTGTIEIINNAYTSILASLTDGGNLSTSGTISAGAYSAGQVIKDIMLSNSEVTVVSTTIAPSGSTTNFVTYNYTPVSSSSYLIVHFHLSKYQPQGTTDDSWYSQLLVDGSEIAYAWQMVNDNGTGTSGRSGVLFPLTGRYTNSSTSSKQIQVAAKRDAADDSIIIDNTATSMWLRITEIAR